MSTRTGTNRKEQGLIAAIVGLVVVGLAITTAVAVWALDRPRGLQVTPSSIQFGDQDVGRQSSAQTVRVTNRGGQPTIRSIRIDGENAREFTVTDASTCVSGPFPTDASCTIVVRFAPMGAGHRSAMLFVSGLSGGPGVALWGTGRTS